jgi:hypothetical protein
MKTKEEIEQLAESEDGTEIGSIRGSNPYDLEKDRKNGYIKGYTQCQEDMAHKKYTEQDMRRAYNKGNNTARAEYEKVVPEHIKPMSFEEFINSLNKQEDL